MPTQTPNRKYMRSRRTSQPQAPRFVDQPTFRWDVLKTVFPGFCAAVVAIVTMWFSVQAQGSHLTALDETVAKFQAAKEQRISDIATINTRQEQQGKSIEEMKQDLKEVRNDIKTLLQRSVH